MTVLSVQQIRRRPEWNPKNETAKAMQPNLTVCNYRRGLYNLAPSPNNNCTVFTLSLSVGNCTNSCLVLCLPRYPVVTQGISMSFTFWTACVVGPATINVGCYHPAPPRHQHVCVLICLCYIFNAVLLYFMVWKCTIRLVSHTCDYGKQQRNLVRRFKFSPSIIYPIWSSLHILCAYPSGKPLCSALFNSVY